MRLTDTQREVIATLRERHNNGSPIYPEIEFPARNARDNGKRRAITQLYKKGFLRKHPDVHPSMNVYQLPEFVRSD